MTDLLTGKLSCQFIAMTTSRLGEGYVKHQKIINVYMINAKSGVISDENLGNIQMKILLSKTINKCFILLSIDKICCK